MKKTFERMRNIFVVCSLLALVACEVIPENEQMIPIEMEQTNRTTLIVEFSAMACNNCPMAAETAHNLLAMYGENLVVVEMHPASNSLTAARKPEWDYTCPESDQYYLFFGNNTIAPLPNGVVNMTQTDGSYFVDYTSWGALYNQYSKQGSHIALTHSVLLDSTNNAIQIQASIQNNWFEADSLQYIAWLTEDSIVGPQMMPNGKVDQKYVHNHLLRDAITDLWGMPIEVNAEDATNVSFTYTLPEKVVAKNCNIVGIVMKNGEAIQVNEYKLNNIIK